MHTGDTVQEKLSLAYRFGVTIYYGRPDKKEFQEIVRVLLSPHGDMKFLHRLYDVIRKKCLTGFPYAAAVDKKNEADFDYRFSFVIYGAAGLIRAWVNRNCAEPAVQMAELADALIRRGSL